MLGLIIPIFQKKFVKDCVASVLRQTKQTDIVICIVNDGRVELVSWFDAINWPSNVHVLHLPENRCFAGANNAGWLYLLQLYPNIQYLGTLNDDTRCRPGCMDYLVECLESHPGAGMVSAVQHIPQGLFRRKASLATWRFGGIGESKMVLEKKHIEHDTQVPLLGGMCLVAPTQRLLAAGMFDPNYINSCEDVDLSLAIRKNGWDLYVAARAHLIHYAGKSRYIKDANPSMLKSHELLQEKWGENLNCYNDLQYF